jgi:hypothetical protein
MIARAIIYSFIGHIEASTCCLSPSQFIPKGFWIQIESVPTGLTPCIHE